MPLSDPTVQWFLARDGKPHGPMSAVEMAKIVELGHLRDGDLVWRPGFAEWLPGAQVFPPQPAPVPVVPTPAPEAPHVVAAPAPGPLRPSAGTAPAHAPASAAGGEAWVMPAQPNGGLRGLQGSGHGPSSGNLQRPIENRPAGGAMESAALNRGPRPGEPLSEPSFDPGLDNRPRPNGGRRPLAREPSAPRRKVAALWLGVGLVVLSLIVPIGYVIYKWNGGSELRAASATKSGAPQTAPEPVKAAPPQAPQPAPAPPKAQPLLPVEGIDKEMQASPIWKLAKAEFPEWYAVRLQDVARLRADRRDDAAVAKHLAEQIVVLRRQFTLHALAASPEKLKKVAQAFHANLAGLAKHSPEACFGFISLGELSPIVLKLSRAQEHAGLLEAQVVSVLEAIVDGRRQPQAHRTPTEQDYNTLSRELRSRGWTDADLQLFADARALSQTPPERVCRLVQDWFSGQLAVKDPAVQLRLLVEALRPIVAG